VTTARALDEARLDDEGGIAYCRRTT
jgi:hypothetical protein